MRVLHCDLEDPAVTVTSDPDDEGLLSVYASSLARMALQVLGDILHHCPPSDVILLHLQAKGRRFNKVSMSLINFRKSPLI